MVEFALIVPILLILLLGIVNFGVAYNTQITLEGAAREGARALALGKSADDAVNASGGVAITVSDQTPCPDGDSDAYASVTTSKDVEFKIPFVIFDTKTLTATASMRCGL